VSPTRGLSAQFQTLARHRFLRFLVVGGMNTAFGYACFAALVWAGLHYTLALLLATIAGVLFNFKTTGALVFGSSDTRLLWRFIAVYAVVYTANLAALALLQAAGIHALTAQALLVLPIAVASYLLNRHFVFPHG
jgi:putative flippase GtrA